MQENFNKPGRISYSMLWVSLGLGSVYWIVDAIITLLTSTNPTFLHTLLGIDNRGFWLRLIVCQCLFAIFGSHVHYTTKKLRESEEALREREEQYRLVSNNVPDIIYSLDGEGKIITINNAAFERYGYTEQEAKGKPFLDFVHPEDHEILINSFLKAMEDKRKFTTGLQFRIIDENGLSHWFELNAHARFDSNDLYTGEDGVLRDITDRKQVEEALRESEEKYRLIAENTADLISILDMNLRLIYVSNASMRLRGFTVEEATGQTLKQVLTPESMRLASAIFEEEMQMEASGTADPDRTRILELEQYKKGGSTIWVEVHLSFMRAKNGKPIEILMVTRDLTERKQAEKVLAKAEEKFRLITENMLDCVALMDTSGTYQYVTPSYRETLGYEQKDMIGITGFSLTHPDDLERIVRLYLEGIEKGWRETSYETRLRHKDGHYVSLEIRSHALNDPQGKIVGGVIAARDITARKQAEEEKRLLEERLQQADKMEAIGTLAGGIAHDFNNLLAGIQGYVSMTLMNLKENDQNYERIQRIQDQVQSGSDLTRQLLGFARGGRYEIKPTDINEILEKTSSMFGRTKKEISIQRKSAKDLWIVEVDRGQMEQVFINLYVNAWQAMPGGGDIYLETQNALLNGEQALFYSVKPGRYVKITITDTGMGMDEKTQERIFEPFFTTKEMGRGTGLGLATVYGIIKGHGGMIYVESEPGHGTTFTIYLPASEKEVKTEEIQVDEIVMGTETILVIDDEKTVMEVNKELLETMGYTVYAAGSGQEGLAVYMEKKDKIDLVILDMIMPGISGSVTFDRLRQINPEVKVLLSSGYSLNGEAQAIIDRGCNGFLQKPFKLEELSRKVREMFG